MYAGSRHVGFTRGTRRTAEQHKGVIKHPTSTQRVGKLYIFIYTSATLSVNPPFLYIYKKNDASSGKNKLILNCRKHLLLEIKKNFLDPPGK